MTELQNRTTVRTFRAAFGLLDRVAPPLSARLAVRLWFTLPPRPWPHALPTGDTPFEVEAPGTGGRLVRGHAWGSGPTVYLVHGWGGRGGQLAGFVEPLVAAGHRVVMFDGPSHGDSDPGAAGPRTTDGVELGKALDAVAAQFGPAHAVVAHSFGALTALLTLKYGWLSSTRLVLLAPMSDFTTAFDGFQRLLGFGPRTRRRTDLLVPARVGLPVEDFSVSRLLREAAPLPTLVVHDRGDRQTSYDDSARLAREVGGVTLVTTDGLGHLPLLRDRAAIGRVVDFVATAAETGAAAAHRRPGDRRAAAGPTAAARRHHRGLVRHGRAGVARREHELSGGTGPASTGEPPR